MKRIAIEAQLETAQRQGAELRETFIEYLRVMGSNSDHHKDDCPDNGACDDCKLSERINRALSPDVGRDYVPRFEVSRAIEAERENAIRVLTEARTRISYSALPGWIDKEIEKIRVRGRG